jgi:hypothetical protein
MMAARVFSRAMAGRHRSRSKLMAEQHPRQIRRRADIAATLERIVEQARSLEEVRKKDLQSGDRVLVTTRNSLYTIWVLGDGLYWVWGGWFDRRSTSPQLVRINGCTWGGSAIKQDIVAARGLRLEFGNRVLTTPIKRFCVIRSQIYRCTN